MMRARQLDTWKRQVTDRPGSGVFRRLRNTGMLNLGSNRVLTLRGQTAHPSLVT